MKIAKVMHNIGESLKTSRNVRKVKNMLGDCFYTEAKKLGGGAFEVRAFRPVSDNFSYRDLEGMSAYSVAQKALTKEGTPACIVKYDPQTGIETTVRGKGRASDVFYKVTQKPGEEPVVDESVVETVGSDLKSLVESGVRQIKKALGKYIPTLDNIKK
ncbi:hypothetical protein IKA92_04370 [bacterium]|nr:hypothetical protein [bacterium]